MLVIVLQRRRKLGSKMRRSSVDIMKELTEAVLQDDATVKEDWRPTA